MQRARGHTACVKWGGIHASFAHVLRTLKGLQHVCACALPPPHATSPPVQPMGGGNKGPAWVGPYTGAQGQQQPPPNLEPWGQAPSGTPLRPANLDLGGAALHPGPLCACHTGCTKPTAQTAAKPCAWAPPSVKIGVENHLCRHLPPTHKKCYAFISWCKPYVKP